jgi:hypothetical protein
MSKMCSHCSFGHLKHKLLLKERLGFKLAIWLPTTKHKKSTRFPYVQATCNIPLENSQQGLQLCFRPHCNRTFAQKIMRLQSHGSPRIESHLGVALVERRRVYYKGEGGGFPQVRAVVSLVCPSCPWLVLAPKVLQLCTNHFVLVLCKFVWVIEVCHFFLVPSQSSNTPLYPFIVLRAKERASIPCSFVVFSLGLTFESFKELGVHQQWWHRPPRRCLNEAIQLWRL